jgi:3-phosphoglycerate kinase
MTFNKKTLTTVPIEGNTVLLRADYNVPLKDDGTIADDFRIRASLPTIEYLLKNNCKVVIISHLGRPEGRDASLSLEPVAVRLSRLLKMPVHFVNETVGDRVKMAVKRAPKRSVVILENLRFDPREEANDEEFAKQLAAASGARYFVQDGFGVVHRAHASTDAIEHYLPGVAGFLLEREVTTITNAMKAPERPLIAVMGGAKVSDKIALVQRFVEVADRIIIGGAMANTFLAYKGYDMGKSKVESGQEKVLDAIYTAAARKVGEKNVDEFIMLPEDLAVTNNISAAASRLVVGVDALEPDDIALDIGDATSAAMADSIASAKTVIWNGTLGYAELPKFAKGSAQLAEALASNSDITSIIGGGDTADFVQHWDKKEGASFTHVSTGGGASLELMAGEKLPGVESLLDA